MPNRLLGKELEVSAVGLGCMGFTHAYGTAMDETEAAKAIAEAVDMGYTFLIRRNAILVTVPMEHWPITKIWLERH